MSIYGEGAQGLASTESIPVKEAEDILDKLHVAYPQLAETMDKAQNQAKKQHYVETISGFRRRLDTVLSSNKSKASRALRQAFNAIVQGSGSYITNNALILLRETFLKLKLKSKIVLTVHDSIVVDCCPEEVALVCKLMPACFENLNIPEIINNDIGDLKVPDKYVLSNGKFRYPLKGEVEFGLNYNDAVDYDADLYRTFKSPKGYCKYMHALAQLEDHKDILDPEDKQVSVIDNKIKYIKDNINAFREVV